MSKECKKQEKMLMLMILHCVGARVIILISTSRSSFSSMDWMKVPFKDQLRQPFIPGFPLLASVVPFFFYYPFCSNFLVSLNSSLSLTTHSIGCDEYEIELFHWLQYFFCPGTYGVLLHGSRTKPHVLTVRLFLYS